MTYSVAKKGADLAGSLLPLTDPILPAHAHQFVALSSGPALTATTFDAGLGRQLRRELSEVRTSLASCAAVLNRSRPQLGRSSPEPGKCGIVYELLCPRDAASCTRGVRR